MQQKIRYLLLFTCIIQAFVILSLVFFPISIKSAVNDETSEAKLLRRLERLEPEKPINMDDPPFYKEPLPSKVLSISEVINKGKEIPIRFIYNNPDWKRQAYKEYWHSNYSGGRWSRVPTLIHFAMHHVFTTPPTVSSQYNFIHNLGILNECDNFNYKGLVRFEYIETIIMQNKVNKIYTYGNQVILLATPQRTGLQNIAIPIEKLKPFNPDENILIQLAASDGGEIDYTTATLNLPKAR